MNLQEEGRMAPEKAGNWYRVTRDRVNPVAIAYSAAVGTGAMALSVLQIPSAALVLELCKRGNIDLGLFAVASLAAVTIVAGLIETKTLHEKGMSSNLTTNILHIPIKNSAGAVILSSALSIGMGFIQDPINLAAIGHGAITQNADIVFANQAARAFLLGGLGIAANAAILSNQTKGFTRGLSKIGNRIGLKI